MSSIYLDYGKKEMKILKENSFIDNFIYNRLEIYSMNFNTLINYM